MHYLLGLDIGSSAVKVGAFAPDGRTMAVASRQYPTAEPQPGFKEQNPFDWWNATVDALHEVTGAAGPGHPVAIGATGHISSFTFVNAVGEPLRPSIGFQDQRAVAEVDELYARFTRAELADALGIDLPPAATWPLPKLLWLKKNEPETLRRTRHLLQAKDYINLRLTGCFASDCSSNRGLVDFRAGRPAAAVLAALGLPDLLPSLYEAEKIIGLLSAPAARETGLPEGTPVVAGWNDLNACLLGSGVVEVGQAFNVTGTSEHIGVVTDTDCRAPELVSAPYLKGKRLLYGVTSCGGGSLDWFRRFSGASMPELLESVASAAGRELLFLPYLEGERSPVWDPRAAGVLAGIHSVHELGDVARAILEGVAFSLRQNFEIVLRHAHADGAPLIVSGGAARVGFWNQLKSDIFVRPVVTLENPHAGILGGAVLAAVGAGLFRDCESAARTIVRAGGRYYPRLAEASAYDRLYPGYCELYPAFRKVLSGLHSERREANQERTMTKEAIVFGAGKIARGFIGHLLTLSGYHITFVEKNAALLDLLAARRRYKVHIMGAPEKSITIRDFDVLSSDNREGVASAVAAVDVIFVSIGGPNLPQIAPLLAAGLAKRSTGINIILGENYFQPAQWLRGLIREHLAPERNGWFEREVGIVETMILRSTIEPTEDMKAEDPLCLKAQDMWEMPADKEAFAGPVPEIQGLAPKENFQGGLIRKLFTYNCINAVIAYPGYLKRYELLADAANDPELVALARAAYGEVGAALCQRYGFDPDDQKRFAESAIAKYQKREIVDPIERNTRDPLRKLSRHDRLVGPACLAAEHGIRPVALARAIGAALHYDFAEDPAARQMQELIREKGIGGALPEITGIAAGGDLCGLIAAAYEEYERKCAAANS